ncbi:MAG: 2-oxo acid dehydrogenase subunit E2 [Candidatus Heimdallarchaeota archaeon]|nr:2-oxo acid dehydrogenase subunit E2 [Candidatus Heimdallarchaeota archaeon]
MTKEKNYHKRKLSANRMILADYNHVAYTLPNVFGLMEVDITDALAKIAEIKEKRNYNVSMTAWVAKCVGQTVMENKELNTYRKGRKLIVFDEVDISVIIEVTTKNGKKVPYNHVIRNVETKSVKTITEEIRSLQDKVINEKEQLSRGTTFYTSLYTLVPKFLRKFIIKSIITNPFRLKKVNGTVGITSMGMFIKGQGGWLVPFRDKTLNIATGGIKENAIEQDGKIVKRKLLCTTFLINHDIIDGAPGVRFIARVSELMGGTYYLDDLEKI